ncbi:DUF799 domain-containing protein [Cupriavidus respiraculi]|uniref:Lipoprotein/NMB1162 n=1 Tax=Cupriavidus respiraculi TaxID=195930 RepID=A0ABN7Z6P3_9BURK|nr:DUF799 domain-containing protein [Cupriavidus respiraculi]MBY4946958.1 DUF799 domain-containing protein [Cupriavidus respiraculi]CAG9181633.1 Putative lipoprotein/NMB1162 [Cupriavidus respiraculi]
MKTLCKRLLPLVAVAVLATGCATPRQVDYAAFKQARPRTILVLPPQNDSPEVQASYSVLSQATFPLAEAGYYVMPVTLVDETFKQNGLTQPGEIHAVAPEKLREIFGADAALYITVTNYGTRYTVINSATVVTANAKLVDLKTGTSLWSGQASASNNEGGNSGGGGLVGMLVAAAVKQIVNSAMDASHSVAGVASNRLLSAGQPGGILYGPRSPKYSTD